jgi:hypothetical protein
LRPAAEEWALEAPAPGSASALAIVGVDATLDQPAALHAATNAFAARPTSAAVIPGLYSAEPIPKPPAPALREGAMRSGVTPPTGKRCVSCGSAERHAFKTSGGGKELQSRRTSARRPTEDHIAALFEQRDDLGQDLVDDGIGNGFKLLASSGA